MALRPLPVGTEPVLAGLDPGTGCGTGPAAPVTGDPHCSQGTAALGIVALESRNTGEVVAAGELLHCSLCCSTPRSFSGESYQHHY